MKSIDKLIKYKPFSASDDELLFSNPDRGFRTELVMYVVEKQEENKQYDGRTVFASMSDEELREKFDFLWNIYFKEEIHPKNNLFLAYVYFTDYHNTDLTDGALHVLKLFFEYCREKKVKSMLRVSYNDHYGRNWRMSEENKRLLASECADEATILKHIDQMAPIVAEYKDTIHTISCGFVGFVGEWDYNYQYPVVDYATVIKAIVEKLCVPNNLYFSIRSPEYKDMMGADYEYKGYISHNNDAMYGEQPNKEWRSGSYYLGHPVWQTVIDEGAFTPQDGEMFTISALLLPTN